MTLTLHTYQPQQWRILAHLRAMTTGRDRIDPLCVEQAADTADFAVLAQHGLVTIRKGEYGDDVSITDDGIHLVDTDSGYRVLRTLGRYRGRCTVAQLREHAAADDDLLRDLHAAGLIAPVGPTTVWQGHSLDCEPIPADLGVCLTGRGVDYLPR